MQKVEEEEDEEGGGEDPPCDLPPLFSFPFVALFLLKSLRPDSKRGGRMLLLVCVPRQRGFQHKKGLSILAKIESSFIGVRRFPQ